MLVLNILIGLACVCFILKFFMDEHYRQENQKRMSKFTDLLDKMLPKAFPSLFQDEVPGEQVVGNVIPDAQVAGFNPFDTVPPGLDALMGEAGRFEEMHLRNQLRELTLAVLEGHSFQIDFATAQAKAQEIILDLQKQSDHDLPLALKNLLPKTEIQTEPQDMPIL